MDEPEIPPLPCPEEPSQLSWPFRWAWQLAVLIAGIATILVGVALLPLPGPGTLVIVAGIGILSTEFIWAKYVLLKIRNWAMRMLIRIRAKLNIRRRSFRNCAKKDLP